MYVCTYVCIYICLWRKGINKLRFHPDKPVSWLPTHPLMSGQPRNRLVGMKA